MNNLGNLFNLYSQLRSNPMQLLRNKFNLPNNVGNNPQDIIQYLLNTNQVSQDQVNRAMQMRNDPMIQQLLKPVHRL